MRLNKNRVKKLVLAALKEDSSFDDITFKALGIKTQKAVSASIRANEDGILCGVSVAAEVFSTLSKKAVISAEKGDSERIRQGDTVMRISAPARSLLAGERTALNILSHLSGIASLTGRYVKEVEKVNPSCRVYDTRKTLPGLRMLEKYAVRCGGGNGHRRDLAEQVLIKENYLASSGLSVYQAVKRAKQSNPGKLIETEVEDGKQLSEALAAGADIIMLDDFNLDQIQRSCAQVKRAYPGVVIEVSGGVTLKNIAQIAKAGADRISVGRLTSSAPSVDFSLRIG